MSKKTSLIVYLNYKAVNGEDIKLFKFSQRACRIDLIRKWGKECQIYYFKKRKWRSKQGFEMRKRQVNVCGYLELDSTLSVSA